MRLVWTLVALGCGILPAVAAGEGDVDRLPETCGQALDLIGAGDSRGYALLFDLGMRSLGKDEQDRTSHHFKRQWESIRDVYGSYLGHEVIQDFARGESLRRLVLIARLERNIVRCDFMFYRPKGQWKLLHWGFRCNDEATESLFRGDEPAVARAQSAGGGTTVK